MDNSKNKDIVELISQILEYTEDHRQSDHQQGASNEPRPPECRCKSENGFCGDDPPVDCPEALFPTEELCLCAEDPLMKCPKCPPTPTCGCKDTGDGPCGDDTSTCPANEFGAYDIAGCGGFCDPPVCPKCWPPSDTPTSSSTPCYCFDCGYSAFNSGDCTKVTCQSGDCSPPKDDCYDCPTNSPTPSCDNAGDPCVCDSGTDCGNCAAPDYKCVNQHSETCSNGCVIFCGSCEKVPTVTPTPPTPTDTRLCPCDCAMYPSMSACNDAKRKYCSLNCECSPNPCSGDDCKTNSECTDLIIDPTPTPCETPTPTCPEGCEDVGCRDPGDCNSGNCSPNGNDVAACCRTGPCGINRCPLFTCDICVHQRKTCRDKGGFSSKSACDKSVAGSTLDMCEDCGVTGECGIFEPCWCIVPIPTGSPSLTPCNCENSGYTSPGHCGQAGTCEGVDLVCKDGSTIPCDICCTPTPSSTCVCQSGCYEYGPDCQSAKEDIENNNKYAQCSCSPKACSSDSNKECTCLTCTYITPTPETQSPSCAPRPGDCCYYGICNGKNVGCQKCREWGEHRKVPGDDPRCPGFDCYKKEITGSAAFRRDIGHAVWNPNTGKMDCNLDGVDCTTAQAPVCNTYRKALYGLQNEPGPNYGVSNC